MEVISLPFVVLFCALAFCLGVWLGWSICNARWSDAARLNVPVQWRGERYHVFTDVLFDCDDNEPPDHLSAE